MHTYIVNKQNIKAVILAGGCDFGRCQIAKRLPTALWPIIGKPVLEKLLVHLADQGIKRAVICSNGDSTLLKESINISKGLDVKFLDEQLPLGTAGCLRDVADSKTDELLMLFPASIVNPPKIDTLIKAHCKGSSCLTMVFNPSSNDLSGGESAGIYICESAVVQHIPLKGYFDIKEGLIPELLRKGKSVHTVIAANQVGNFHNWQGYLEAVISYLESAPQLNGDLKLCKRTDSQILWKTTNTKIDPDARIYGPVVIMDSASVSKGSFIWGPTVLGRNVGIGRDSIVVTSVLWDDVRVGPNCEIHRCVVDNNTTIGANTVVEEKAIPFKPKGLLERTISHSFTSLKNNASKLSETLKPKLDGINRRLPAWLRPDIKITPWFATGAILIAFLWSYWPGITDLWSIWLKSDEYSSGLLVPLLAVYILWSRRDDIIKCPIRPSLWGIAALLAAQGVRLFGLYFMYSSAERLSITLSIAALLLLLCGWQFLRKVSPVLLFLCLMLPWPKQVQTAVSLPFQHWATSSAVFCLETFGYEVTQEGNIIHIGQTNVAVAEACNGLRMVTAFFVINGLVVLLIKRKWWEKLIILASSIPIALMCNTTRLAVTAVAFTFLIGNHWETVFHDFGGYAMMPLALAAVVVELKIMTKLTNTPEFKPQKRVITKSRSQY
jgi:exosortase